MKFQYHGILAILIFCISCRKEYSSVNDSGACNSIMTVKSYSLYPQAKQWATLAFEDSWPNLKDTDMNDLVVDYSYRFGLNKNGDVVQIKADYTVVASGASFQNGLGLELPFASSLVKSVSGQRLDAGYIKTSANGTESGQTDAVVIPFDNYENLLHYYDYSYFINVEPTRQRITGDTVHLIISLTKPVSCSIISKAPFNPFLICNMCRSREIHLPGGNPTAKADKSLFNTGDDYTKGGTRYVSKKKFPWALNFIDNRFRYPVERASVSSAYPHYVDWVRSGGQSYKDWYTSTQSGYRNNANIFY